MSKTRRLVFLTLALVALLVVGALVWQIYQQRQTPPLVPVEIPVGPARVTPQIDVGGYELFVLGPDGKLWSLWQWMNHSDPPMSSLPKPRQTGPVGDWNEVSPGEMYVTGLKNDGTLWNWGAIIPEPGAAFVPGATNTVQITSETNWSRIESGVSSTLALKTDGTLWTWGFNNEGQLGDGTKTNSNIPIQIGTNGDWTAVAAGGFHAAGIRADGSLWVWGSDQLAGANRRLAQVGSETNWTAVYAGAFYTVALKRDGSACLWGENQAVLRGETPSQSPTMLVNASPAHDWLTAACGNTHLLILKTNGTLWAMGRNRFGELGDGSTTSRTGPVRVGNREDWVAVSAGSEVSFGVTADGCIWSWGIHFYEAWRVPFWSRLSTRIVRAFGGTANSYKQPEFSTKPRLIARFVLADGVSTNSVVLAPAKK